MTDKGHQGEAMCPSGPPLERMQPHGKKLSKRELTDRLTYAEAKNWSMSHKRQISPLPLPDATERRIRQWFELADDSGDGQLNKTELEFALKASGIPVDSEAILEIISLFDFDGDGEIAWREFHNYFAHEVMAGRDPLGSDYVLPSGTALPLGSMIGAIRRRKIINDVEKGGKARGFWSAEGPEFLRYLLESEQYTLDQPGASRTREVIMRILAYKPAPSKEADPAAVEDHRKRIERLKMILMRTASGRPPTEPGDAAAAGRGSPRQNAAGKGPSPARRNATGAQRRGAADAAAGATARAAGLSGDGDAGAAAEGSGTASLRAVQHPVRFAAALAATEAALAELEAAERHQQAERGCRGQSRNEAAAKNPTDCGPGGIINSSSAGGSSSGEAASSFAVVDDAVSSAPIEAALACASQMRRLEAALEQNRQRAGTSRPRPAAGSVALAGSRAGNPRYPVVLPVQIAAAAALESPPPAATPRRLTGDGGSWAASGTTNRQETPTAAGWAASGPSGSGSAVIAEPSGGGGGWSAGVARQPVPPPSPPLQQLHSRTSTGFVEAGRESAGRAAGVRGSDGGYVLGRRPRPPPLRCVGPDSGDALLGHDDGLGGDGPWAAAPASGGSAASAGSRPFGSLSLQIRSHAEPGTLPREGTPLWEATTERELTAVCSGSGGVGSGPAAAPGAGLGDAAQPHDTFGPPRPTSTDGGPAAVETPEAGTGADTVSSPQASVLRLGTQLLRRSASTGRGPFSAQLIRSARATGRAQGAYSPRQARGCGEAASLSGAATSPSPELEGRSSRLSSLCAAGASPRPTTSGEAGARPSAEDACAVPQRPSPGLWTASACAAGPVFDPSGLHFDGSSAHGSAAAAAFTAAISRPTAVSPPAFLQSPPPARAPGKSKAGRAEAAATAADIRRMAWDAGAGGLHGQQAPLQHSQHGGWPQASAPASPAVASAATSARTSLAGNTGNSHWSATQRFPAPGPACAGPYVGQSHSRSGESNAHGVPLRRSLDLAEYSAERVVQSPRVVSGGHGGASSGAAATTAAAAAAWLGAAKASASGEGQSGGVSPWMAAAAAALASAPEGTRSAFFAKPQVQIPAQLQNAGSPGAGYSPTQIAHTPAGLTDGCGGGSPPPPEWHAAASPPPPQQQPSPQTARGSGAPLQPTISRNSQPTAIPTSRSQTLVAVAAATTGANAAGGVGARSGSAALAAGSSRRSFELEPRAGGWRASAASPGSAAVAARCSQPGAPAKEANGDMGWMRGRLMRTCLAAALRPAAQPQQQPEPPPPPSPPAAPHSGGCQPAGPAANPPVAPGGGWTSGRGTGGWPRVAEDYATHAAASGAALPEASAEHLLKRGDSSRRKALGGPLGGNAVIAKPGPLQLPEAVQGSGGGKGAARGAQPPELRLPSAATPQAVSGPLPQAATDEVPAAGAECEPDQAAASLLQMQIVGLGREPQLVQAAAAGSRWPRWPRKGDAAAGPALTQAPQTGPASARKVVDAVAAAAAAPGGSRPLQVLGASGLRTS